MFQMFHHQMFWQVKVDNGVPAVIRPVKPKYWFFGATEIKAQTAILLK